MNLLLPRITDENCTLTAYQMSFKVKIPACLWIVKSRFKFVGYIIIGDREKINSSFKKKTLANNLEMRATVDHYSIIRPFWIFSKTNPRKKTKVRLYTKPVVWIENVDMSILIQGYKGVPHQIMCRSYDITRAKNIRRYTIVSARTDKFAPYSTFFQKMKNRWAA